MRRPYPEKKNRSRLVFLRQDTLILAGKLLRLRPREAREARSLFVQKLAALNLGARRSVAMCGPVRVARESGRFSDGSNSLRASWKPNQEMMSLGCSGASGAGGCVSEARHAAIGEWQAEGSQP
jgi:hypothetical protein